MPVESRGAPYPVGTDVATVAAYIQNLASWTNLRPGITPMTSGARAALSGIEVWDHRYVGETDTGKLMARWQGAWVEIADLDTFPTRLFPIGGIGIWATDIAPAGWLLCDGTSYPRTGATLELFNAIGTRYGAIDGSSFSVPNLKGKVVVARDAGQAEFDVMGETGGAKTVALTAAQNGQHNHTQTPHLHTGTTQGDYPDHVHGVTGQTDDQGWHDHSVGTYNSDVPVYGIDMFITEGGSPYGHMITANEGPYIESVGTHSHTGLANGNGEHRHNFGVESHGASARHQHYVETSSESPAIQNSGSGTAHQNMPPYCVMSYIIKS